MKAISLIAGILLIHCTSCTKDDSVKKSEPTVVTTPVTSINPTSAVSGGNIPFDGHAQITVRGVTWSKAPMPTIITSSAKVEGSGTGSYTSELTDLSPNTTYHVRAYATNSVGTSYGEDITFKTLELFVTDADDNIYATVQIGTQIWLKENLKTTKYNDGTSIPINTNTTDDIATAAYSWYNNDKITYGNVYGGLYNFYAVQTGKLCPTGWHVPTVTEFYTLREFLGGVSTAGGALKEQGTTHWTSPNTGANNSTGFTALPGGMKSPTFDFIGQKGDWWTSTGNVFEMINDSGEILNYGVSASYLGLSVRCLKN